MPILIFLIFIAVPIAEIAVFIQVGDIIGLWPTLLLIILTAIIGVALLKRQGLAVMTEAKSTVEAGGLPVQSVIDGACLLVAGAFLLTPGLLTDSAGFLLLIPAVRRRLAHWLIEKVKASKSVDIQFGGPGGPFGSPDGSDRKPPGDRAPVIEGEFSSVETVEETDDAPRKRSGNGQSPWRQP